MKKVVFLMSDTGGGHRAAADAIRVAMEMRYPDQYTFELVDVYRRYTPFPFNALPDIYPPWVNWAGMSWSLVYRSADAPLRSRVIMAGLYHCWKRGLSQMVAEHNADVIVPAHALFSRPAMRAFQEMSTTRPPFVTVITDLVSTHAFWYEKEIERYLAPTQAAYDRGLMYGLSPEQIRLTGLPVNPHFMANLPEKCEARARLHWQQDLATVLLVGGGDGMGPVYQIARAINARHLPIQLVIVAGRNGWLKRRLDHAHWNQPTHIYPFVKNMSELMAGADILITKAGPATISEACIAGLPMILSGAVPGQEAGNVTYVVDSGAGVYAPGPARVARALDQWIAAGPEMLASRVEKARALSKPGAVWDIAEEIHLHAQSHPVRTRLRVAYDPPRLHPAPEEGWLI